MAVRKVAQHRSPALEAWRRISVAVLFTVVVGGLFYPPLGLVAAAMMVTLLGVAIFRGRYWCGNLCPRGSFLDLLMRWVTPGRRFPAFLRRLRVRLVILILLMSAMAWSLATLPVEVAPDMPGGIYGLIGAMFVRMCLITTLGAIFMALVSQERAWCAVCPMGTLQHLIDRADAGEARARILTNAEACRDCAGCERACPMDIPVREYLSVGEVTHPDCLRCGACVLACPTDALRCAGACATDVCTACGDAPDDDRVAVGAGEEA